MRVLARLMSHGFAVALVVLLAIGFIYRGELFPEWELPDFLVLDSTKKMTTETQSGTIEPAPIQDDWMASATGNQDAPVNEIDDSIPDTKPSVEEVVESSPSMDAEDLSSVTSNTSGSDDTEIYVEAVEEDASVLEVDEPITLDVQEPVVESGEIVEVAESAADAGIVDEDAASGTAEAADEEEMVKEESGSVTASIEVAVEDSLPEFSVGEEEPGSPAGTDTDMPRAVQLTPELATESDPPGAAAPVSAAENFAPIPTSAEPVEIDAMVSSYQLLASAREAYWMHDYEAAEDLYRRMIMDDPYNPDGYGELANMYFSQGNWEAAASAYYEAGLRLVKDGLLAPARDLVDVIRGLNGSQADALQLEIQKAGETSQ